MDQKKLSDKILAAPSLFARWELAYVKNRIPFEKEKPLNQFAFIWAEKIGHREKMADVVKSSENPEAWVSFALRFSSFKRKMKNQVKTAEHAFFWARAFPEDKNEMKKMVCGGEWAVRWADEIGDEDEMKSRLQTRFWKYQFDQKVNGEKVNYATP